MGGISIFLHHLANQAADLLAKKKRTKLLLTAQGFLPQIVWVIFNLFGPSSTAIELVLHLFLKILSLF